MPDSRSTLIAIKPSISLAIWTDAKLGTHLEDMRKKISRLSLGASTGSINVLWTMNKHREVFENLSPEFRKKIVDVDFTCNERFWHNSNYDMCLLGDAENRWKPHVQNDSDFRKCKTTF